MAIMLCHTHPHIAICARCKGLSTARRQALIVPLSAQVYKLVQMNLLPGVTL